MTATKTFTDSVLQLVRNDAEESGAFGEIRLEGSRLSCAAARSAEPAWYRLEAEDGRWFVSLVTADRWLSESIEADLMHHGDPIEELIEEELLELGFEHGSLEVKHYRSDDMLYTFRSPVPAGGGDAGSMARVAAQCLLAYEAAFRELGDMYVDEEDEE
jgi:hypothetical protein